MRRRVRKSKILPMKYRLIYLILGAGLDLGILLLLLAAYLTTKKMYVITVFVYCVEAMLMILK